MRLFMLSIICVCLLPGEALPQGPDVDELMADTLLTYGDYLDAVEAYHPVAELARLEVVLAENELLRSRGGFDPALYGNYATKEWRNTNYYEALDAGIVLPTWAGVSLHAGYQNNEGVFLNPDKSTPSTGLVNAGLTVQLGAGLLMDNRRAALRQAQIGLEQGQIERQLLLNQLYFEATQAYYNWAFAEEALVIAQEALELASFRYNATRESFKYGDVPAIDTVEAYTQVLNRLYKLREAQTHWVEAANVVSVYLWDEQKQARSIPPGLRPQRLERGSLTLRRLPAEIEQSHPELLFLEALKGKVDIERRLAAEFLRPQIELKYNFLSENVFSLEGEEWWGEHRFLTNNYDMGARILFPIFLRDARGRVGINKVRMKMIDQDYFNKRAQLNASLNAALIEMQNLRDQIDFFDQNVRYLDRLLKGERDLFFNGESSLFFVNARETQLIDVRNIYVQLLAKEHILFSEIRVIAGEGFGQ